MSLTCSQCSAPLKKLRPKSGLCRPCVCRSIGRDPEIRARAAATFAERATPAFRAQVGRAISATKRRQMVTNPAYAATMRDKGRLLGASGLGGNATSNSPEARALIGAAVSIARRKALAWCPAEHLDEYRRLAKKHNAATARSMIEARLTPFERMMQKVANGAGIREVRSYRKADPEVSLTGISSVYGL